MSENSLSAFILNFVTKSKKPLVKGEKGNIGDSYCFANYESHIEGGVGVLIPHLWSE